MEDEKFVNEDAENLEPLDADFVKKMGNLEKKVDFLVDFCKVQSAINNVLRFLIKRKYSENELNEALKEFEEAEKKLKNDEKKEEK